MTDHVATTFRSGLADCLLLAVPLRMAELRHLPVDDLIRLGRAQVQGICEHADTAMYGGKSAGKGAAAIVTGLAALALTAEGGVTFMGLHWCAEAHEQCPNGPQWAHLPPVGRPSSTQPAPTRRSVASVQTKGDVL